MQEQTATPDPGPKLPIGSTARPVPLLGHRPEIDGLRAFAILPILLVHCGVTGLRGGHVGVDIFFVISGYLITAIVQREIVEGKFTLAGFYRRRAVRILPALLTMLAIVLAFGCVLLFPIPLRDLGRSAAATAGFASNFYFYATIDYFSPASALNLLVHTWSLAVEEQFYLLYPPLLLLARKVTGARLVTVMIVVAAISLAVGGTLAVTNPAAGFYLLPARIWELLTGALVAMGAHPRIAARWLREALCWFALAAIVLSAVLIKPTWPFPVPFALPVVGAAALLIAYSPQTSAAKLLSWAPLRGIGLISYSLYLYHRPIIAFYLLGRSWEMTPTDTAVLLSLIFVAAILSYLLVERPALRRWRSGATVAPLVIAGFALVAFVALGLAIAANAERIRRLPPQVARVASYVGFDKTAAGKAQYDTDRCFTLPVPATPYAPACLTPAVGRDNVLLVGDSHAAQLSQALRRAIAPAHLVQATGAGCRPLLETQSTARCRRVILDALAPGTLRSISAVVLAGRWFDVDVQPLAATIRAIHQRGVARVIVVGPVVEYEAGMPDLLGRAMLAGDLSRMAKLRTPDRPVLDRELRTVVARAGGSYVSHVAIECPDGACRLMTADGAPLHIDQSHLTPQATIPVARQIATALGRTNP